MDTSESPGIPLPTADATARDLWGPAWEEQVAAALAWQANRATRASRAGWHEPTGRHRMGDLAPAGEPVPGANSATTVDALMEIGLVLASLSERLLHLQSQVHEKVGTELARRSRPRVLAPPGRGGADAAFGSGRPVNAMDISTMIGLWFEAADSARSELAALGCGETTRPRGLRPPRPAERRQHAVVIDFPDRRRATA